METDLNHSGPSNHVSVCENTSVSTHGPLTIPRKKQLQEHLQLALWKWTPKYLPPFISTPGLFTFSLCLLRRLILWRNSALHSLVQSLKTAHGKACDMGIAFSLYSFCKLSKDRFKIAWHFTETWLMTICSSLPPVHKSKSRIWGLIFACCQLHCWFKKNQSNMEVWGKNKSLSSSDSGNLFCLCDLHIKTGSFWWSTKERGLNNFRSFVSGNIL